MADFYASYPVSGSSASSGITDLIGDVTATGPGSAAATVTNVGGSSAASVHTAELLANAATNANTASAIVKRDASGNFIAGTITASLNGNATNITGNLAFAQSPSPPLTNLVYVDVARADSYTADGTVLRPYKTIQGALTAIGNSASAADVKQPKTVLIGSGTYDEDLTIPNGRILTLVALGTVILGNGAGSNWASTNSRSITVTFNSAGVFGSDIKPALNIMALPASDTTSTFIAEAGGFFISGNLNVAGDGLTNTLNLSSVKLAGNLVHTTAGLTNWQAYRTIIAGTVTTTGNLVLERAYDCRFNSLVSVNAYNMVGNSNFAAGMTVQSIQQNLLPNGMFFTNFAGTFTGPASSLRLDATSDYYFRTNGATLGGSATKVLLNATSSTNAFTLSGADITNKFVTLTRAPNTAATTILDVIGGIEQEYGTDFTVSGAQLSWSGLFLDGVLVAGDKLLVQFN